jgi:hypothetical protein
MDISRGKEGTTAVEHAMLAGLIAALCNQKLFRCSGVCF